MRRLMLGWIVLTALVTSALSAFSANLNDGLVLYYKFDGGRAVDLGPNGRPAELLGNTETVRDDGAPVDPKGCVELAGEAGNMIDCGGGPDVQIAEELSLMAWVKPVDVVRVQMAVGTPYDDGPAWDDPWVGPMIGVRNSQMATWLNIGAVDREYDSGVTVANEWQHLAFTFSGDIAISYVNGEEVAAHDDRDGIIEYDGDPHFIIGESSLTAPVAPFGGRIDEVVLFKRVLSIDEVTQVMQGTIQTAVDSAGKAAASWGYLKAIR